MNFLNDPVIFPKYLKHLDVIDVGVDIAFDQLLDGIFGADFMNHFKGRLPASYVDLMVAFEARKRHASPYRCNPLNIALPFSFIDCYRKYRGKEIDAAIRKYGNVHVRWSSQGMLRLDQEAMRALFHSTLNAILEVNPPFTNCTRISLRQYLTTTFFQIGRYVSICSILRTCCVTRIFETVLIICSWWADLQSRRCCSRPFVIDSIDTSPL